MKRQYFTAGLATSVLAIAALLMGDMSIAAEPPACAKSTKKLKCDWTEASCRRHWVDTGFECDSVSIKYMSNGFCECQCADPGGARKKKETPGLE